jgi:ATP-binding cassette subfamily B protein
VQSVDLHLRRGEVVALVGENGSGKSTLAKLIAGLYTPDHGSVRWDGIDSRQLRRSEIYARTAVVFQDFARLALSAEENIAMIGAADSIDQRRVRAAARATGADTVIDGLPFGYETPLSTLFSGGQDLSGGQWQRIALARAYYRDAPLVILDEPTAALDPRAEHELFASLRQLLAGRTALFISHRFSTVRTADRIYVMDGGRIIESGNHDDLMAADGHYAELFRLQASAYLAEGVTD